MKGFVDDQLRALLPRMAHGMEPADKRDPVLSVRTEPVAPSGDVALGPARTPNGLDARSSRAMEPICDRDVA